MTRTLNRRLRKLPTDLGGLVRHHMPMAIRDDIAYDNAMGIVDALTSIPKLSKDQSEYLDTLTILVEAYERDRHAIETGDLTGRDLLRHLMEANDVTGLELAGVLGVGSSAVSMILSGQREITAAAARKLGGRFGVGAGLFIE